MTIREVIDRAYHLGGWFADSRRAIRRIGPHGPECPITAVATAMTGEYYSPDDWLAAARAIGLPEDEARELARAASGRDIHILLLTRLFGPVWP